MQFHATLCSSLLSSPLFKPFKSQHFQRKWWFLLTAESPSLPRAAYAAPRASPGTLSLAACAMASSWGRSSVLLSFQMPVFDLRLQTFLLLLNLISRSLSSSTVLCTAFVYVNTTSRCKKLRLRKGIQGQSLPLFLEVEQELDSFLSQNVAPSLLHLARAYNSNGVGFGDGYVEVLAATQTPGEAGKKWFQGTADAVRQFHWLFEDARSKEIEDVLILSGDHLYRMDYMDFVQDHRQSGADISISCIPIDDRRASDFGLMKIDDKGRVLSFSEKPKGDDLGYP